MKLSLPFLDIFSQLLICKFSVMGTEMGLHSENFKIAKAKGGD